MLKRSTTANKGKILENRLRKKIRSLVEDVLKEEPNSALDIQEVKAALVMINNMAAGSDGLNYKTNDKGLKELEKKIRDLRIELMNYVEQRSQYTFYGKSPNGFKLVKKGK
tara:strand:+ start:1364 stop:1696 length:333 start_codon:yes stop_codon:yes gene_type:complete